MEYTLLLIIIKLIIIDEKEKSMAVLISNSITIIDTKNDDIIIKNKVLVGIKLISIKIREFKAKITPE